MVSLIQFKLCWFVMNTICCLVIKTINVIEKKRYKQFCGQKNWGPSDEGQHRCSQTENQEKHLHSSLRTNTTKLNTFVRNSINVFFLKSKASLSSLTKQSQIKRY